MNVTAGQASDFEGAAGARYFEWQSRIGQLGGELNLAKFERYVSSDDVVLDFGCGGGYLLERLPGARKLGVEVNSNAQAVARARGIEVMASLGEVPDEAVDVAISNHALEHTLRPYDELRGLRRVLKPGRRLVLWLPLDDWRVKRRAASDPSRHFHAWTPVTLRNLLEEAGFEVEACHVVTHAWSIRLAPLRRVLSPALFDLLCRGIAIARRRRQLAAIARKPEVTA
jgi:SAM-dependent methyltransferase